MRDLLESILIMATVSGKQINNPYGQMVYDDYLERVRELYEERRLRLAAIRTRKEAEKYRDAVAEKAVRCFGPFPRRTPLNAVVTGVLEGKHYRTEKVVYESRPGFQVTANLYIPNKLKDKAPAVLGSCGHAANGKAAGPYQSYAQELARCGFVVLVFDPICQGERDYYYKLSAKDSLRNLCTHAHNMMGKQLDLAGDFFGNWRAWDAMRSLDYLLSRDEVDPDRIAMTGNSGGGTMSLWMWALDRRIRMVGSSCFVTTFLANYENELPQDAEQYPPGMLASGLEMADFLIARAPDPAIVLSQRYCFFDRRGAQVAADEVSRIYRLLGKPESFAFFMGDNVHGYYPDARTAMRRFFCRHENLRLPRNPLAEPQPDQSLWATPKGQVMLNRSRSFQDLYGDILEDKASRRKSLDAGQLQRKLRQLLTISKMPSGPLSYRLLSPDVANEKAPVARYAIRTERRVEAILRKVSPVPGWTRTLDVEKKITLYVPDFSAEQDIANGKLVSLTGKKEACYAVDVRGFGESMPAESGDFLQPYGKDYQFHGFGLMLNESYLGRRVFDLLQVCALLRQEGATSIKLVGRRQGALIALFAAVLDDSLSHVELHEALPSYESVARSVKTDWPASSCLRGILAHFDLPDLYRAFAQRIRIRSTKAAGTDNKRKRK